LWVRLSNVLDDGFKELGVRLDEVTELLELRIASKGIETRTA
jgi:hypothetical protein